MEENSADGALETVGDVLKPVFDGKMNEQASEKMQHPGAPGGPLDRPSPSSGISGLGMPMSFPFPETPVSSRQPFIPPQLQQQQSQLPPLFDPNQMPNMNMMDNFNPVFLQAMMFGSPMGPPSWPHTPSSLPSSASGSMNDSGIDSPPDLSQAQNNQDNEEIYKVQGRLTLNNNSRQFSVTRGEVERRLEYPEAMNSSTLASLFRRAKVQGGGEAMRKDLDNKGLRLAPENRRRKHAETTCFSALTEEEANVMGKQLHAIVQQKYPKDQLVRTMIAQEMQMAAGDLSELAKEAHYASKFLHRLHQQIDQVKVSAGKHCFPPRPQDPLYCQMAEVSALTHGFVLVDQKVWLQAFGEISKLTEIHAGVGSQQHAYHMQPNGLG